MIFHSYDYLIFLVTILAAYWLLPRRGQNILLLAASYVFYGYVHVWFLGMITFTSTIDWFTANQIVKRPQHKKLFLALTLGTNFAILCSFKYLDFFTGGHALQILHGIGFTSFTAADVQALLPVGISFYTYQSASYVVDVYRGQLAPRKNWLDYLLFVSFFPQLVAGPIERAGHLLAQVEGQRIFDTRKARGAVVLILWGYMKKLAIADNAAMTCNKVFSLENPSWPVLWAGVFAFAIQIYADFSAYTDIARGTARLFGFELMQNFNHPYQAASPGEFWRRWHISLSTWFRDYIYISLGGSHCNSARIALNIMATFLLSGLWHGASWNYILWGGYHGCLLVVWRFWENGPSSIRPQRLWPWVQVLFTFALINIGWLMFRETNLSMLMKYFMLNPLQATAADWQTGVYLVLLVSIYSWPLLIHAKVDQWLARHPATIQQHFPGGKWAFAQAGLATLLLLAIILLSSPFSSDFIYFQF